MVEPNPGPVLPQPGKAEEGVRFREMSLYQIWVKTFHEPTQAPNHQRIKTKILANVVQLNP
jgi:hypothetical protein